MFMIPTKKMIPPEEMVIIIIIDIITEDHTYIIQVFIPESPRTGVIESILDIVL